MTHPIGIVRLAMVGGGPTGPFFDFPYHTEQEYMSLVMTLRAEGHLRAGDNWIFYHGIAYIQKIPNARLEPTHPQFEGQQETRQ